MVQVLISGLSLLLIYKYLLIIVGVKFLGVWSIVMAASSIVRASDLGFSSGMVKFVAKYKAHERIDKINSLIQTSIISVSIFLGGIALGIFLILNKIMPLIVPDYHYINEATKLMPYVIVSFVIMGISSVFLSSIDGIQRIDIRNLITIAGTLIYTVAIIIFVHFYGFIGLGYAQVTQSIFMLIVSWYYTHRLLQLPLKLPHLWNYQDFKEMFSYNAYIQLNSIVVLLLDPVTKILLSRYGGLEFVTYYEMANRLVMQVRAIIVNANQVLVPVIADINEKNQQMIVDLYYNTYAFIVFISTVAYTLLAIATPVIGQLWIGYFQPLFVHITYLVIVALALNTLIGPAYFTNLGTGHVIDNTASQILIGLSNIILGLIGGLLWSGYGVVVGYVLAIIIGSAYLIKRFIRRHGISYVSLFSGNFVYLFSAITTFLLAVLIGNDHQILALCLSSGIFILIISRHPMMSSILKNIRSKQSNKSLSEFFRH